MVCWQTGFSQDNQWYVFPNQQPEAAIRYIYVDSADTKWVGGYNNGLHKFSNGIWTHYTTPFLSDNDVRQSCLDGNKNLWITTWNNLTKLNTVDSSATVINVTGQPHDILYSVEIDAKNRIWVGTDGGADPDDGLYMYNGNSWQFYNPTNSPLAGRWVTDLKKDRAGKVWGTCKHLFSIDETSIVNHLVSVPGFTGGPTSMDFDSYNNVWVTFNGGGVGKFNGSSWTIYTTGNSGLPENNLWCIAVDQDNIVWIGTETKGLVRFDGSTWTQYNTSNSPITSNRIDALSVDNIGNLWIAPSYGGLIVYNSTGVSGIKGKLYFDKNNNNIQDQSEPGAPHQMVKVVPGGYVAITDSLGNYSMPIINEGNYYVKPHPQLAHYVKSSPDSTAIGITSSSSYLDDLDFGIQLQQDVHDIAIDITAMNIPRPGFKYSYQLTVSNEGAIPSKDITIKLQYDPRLTLDSSALPYTSHTAGLITWHLDSLPLFNKRGFGVYFTLSTTSSLGSSIQAIATADAIYTDADTLNNLFTLRDTIVGSFDPNDKQSFPQGLGANGLFPNTLTYLVRFQNTGTDTAFNVIIKDTISNNLDLSTLEILSASHSFRADIKNGRAIWFSFNDILLPDSNRNEPQSHGFIKYKINLSAGLPSGTKITNRASIYFDFNLPVVTNIVENVIVPPVIPDILNVNNKCEHNTTAKGKLNNPPVNGSVAIFLDNIPIQYNIADSSFIYFVTGNTTPGVHWLKVRYIISGTTTEKDTSYSVTPTFSPSVVISGQTAVDANSSSTLTATVVSNGSAKLEWMDSTANHTWAIIPGAVQPTLIYWPQSGNKVNARLTDTGVCSSPTIVYSNILQFDVTTAVGGEPGDQNGIRIFPNPTSSFLVVDSLKLFDQWRTLEVVGTDGKVLIRKNIFQRQKEIVDVSILPKGIYGLVLKRKKGRRYSARFIRN